MGMSRRLFGGLLASAPVASMSGSSSGESLAGRMNSAGSAMVDPRHLIRVRQQELASARSRLEGLRRGGDDDDPVSREDDYIATRYKTLRSLGAGPRAMFRAEAMQKARLAREISWLERKIRDLGKEIGL